MKLYGIDKRSNCGSYFASYLQFAHILANSEEEALGLGLLLNFETKPTLNDVHVICEDLTKPTAYFEYYDSDY